uniref:Heat shock protein beta-1 n=1 Tax=Acartia pacifica TaxID=335913 RepID=A0A0U2V1N6_ACAPC|nr:heat shock protein beta-1 [Acartia pacifica]
MSSDKLPVTLRDYFFSDPHFFTWENYDKVKDRVSKVSTDILKGFDSHVRSMTGYSPMHMLETECADVTHEDDKAAKEKVEQAASKQLTVFPRSWMIPSIPGLEDERKELGLYMDDDKELVRFQEDKDGFVLTLDTHMYRPSELHLSVKDNMVNITGKHECKSKDGKKVSIRQFQRMYSLPEGVKKEEVVSNLSADGVLVVTAKKGGKQ